MNKELAQIQLSEVLGHILGRFLGSIKEGFKDPSTAVTQTGLSMGKMMGQAAASMAQVHAEFQEIKTAKDTIKKLKVELADLQKNHTSGTDQKVKRADNGATAVSPDSAVPPDAVPVMPAATPPPPAVA